MEKHAFSDGDRQYVTFGIDGEILAVSVEHVREILDMQAIARIPEAPAFLAGLIDVRGRSVPVVDLRLKLGMAATTITEATRIMVVDVPLPGRTLTLGLIADRVYEVAALGIDQIEAPPELGGQWRSEYVTGVSRRGDRFVLLCDVASLFKSHEIGSIGPISA